MPDLSPTTVLVWWSLMGLCVGSFLNVCVHRFPLEDQTVFRPQRSYCPKCKTQLTWKENLPVLSWLLQKGRCRHCAAPVHWRYPLIELFTAGVWLVTAWHTPFGEWGLLVARTFWLSALIVATFVDFERFEIPDQVSIGGMVLAPLFCLAVPELHVDDAVSIWFAEGAEVGPVASLIGCFAGMATGAGILYAIGWVGTKASGTEAMGFGDVKLMGAGGAFVGAPAVLVALLIAVFVASIFGVLNIVRHYGIQRQKDRLRGRSYGRGRAVKMARFWGRYLPFGPYLALGLGIVLLDWKDVVKLLPFGV